MPQLIKKPMLIRAAGNKIKIIKELIGRGNSRTSQVSIALMKSPQGWKEPGQTPRFNEYSIVLKGMLRIEHRTGKIDIKAGQAAITLKGEWVRYSTPKARGAEYIAICLPAFSPQTVYRDA